jgi:methylated-DNA-[protein]-cysteine S-methyltransferase
VSKPGKARTTTWWAQDTPIGEIIVVSGAEGVHRVAFESRALERAMFVGDARERRDRAVARQFDEWFAGARHEFSLTVAWPDDLSPFARTTLETLVERVPWGETVSYGELAELAGRPRAARAVGSIMAGNPVPFVVPCHRVIAAGHRIGGYGGGRDAVPLKRWLLEREGVRFGSQSPATRALAIPSNP